MTLYGSDYYTDSSDSDSDSDSDGAAAAAADDDDESDDPITIRNERQYPPGLPSQPHTSYSQDDEVVRQRLRRLESEVSLSSRGSSSSSDTESVHNSSDSRLPLLWTRLQEQRQRIRSLRKAMSEQRREIQRLRRKKDDADNAFMGTLRPHLATTNGPAAPPLPMDSLRTHFSDMQAIRTDFNTAEHEYEAKEVEIDCEEKELLVLEAEFFGLLYGKTSEPDNASVKSDEEDHDEDQRPPSRISLLGISAERPADVHPLYRSLLDAVGDRQLAKEHHTDLMMHRDAILYHLETKLKLDQRRDEQGISKWDSTISEDELGSLKSSLPGLLDVDESLTKLGSNLKGDDLEFLREFKVEEKAARERVEETEAEVSRLRTLCIEKDVVPKDAPYYEEYTIFADTEGPKMESMTINDEHPARPGSLAHPRFPILLSNPRHILRDEPLTTRAALKAAVGLPPEDPRRDQLLADARDEHTITALMHAAKNKSDFINRWLLQRLRISPMEVEMLYSVFSSYLKVVNVARWQGDVLYFWMRDGANRSSAIFDGPVTSRDGLEMGDGNSAYVNSEIFLPSHPSSEVELQHPVANRRPTRSEPGDRHVARRPSTSTPLL